MLFVLKLVDFLVGEDDFAGAPTTLKSTYFDQILSAAGKFLEKKLVKNAVFGHFLENYYMASSKLLHIGRPWMDVFVRVTTAENCKK